MIEFADSLWITRDLQLIYYCYHCNCHSVFSSQTACPTVWKIAWSRSKICSRGSPPWVDKKHRWSCPAGEEWAVVFKKIKNTYSHIVVLCFYMVFFRVAVDAFQSGKISRIQFVINIKYVSMPPVRRVFQPQTTNFPMDQNKHVVIKYVNESRPRPASS